jgi:hypothetical protein
LTIRHDIVVISAVLFTIAVLAIVPTSVNFVMVFRPPHYLELETLGELGIVSLAVIALGLIITWTGYLERARSAWFMLLIIVCGWAFPVMLLPFALHHNSRVPLGEWVAGAFHGPGPPRMLAKSVFILSLMVIALILPIRSFFGKQSAGEHRGYPSQDHTE